MRRPYVGRTRVCSACGVEKSYPFAFYAGPGRCKVCIRESAAVTRKRSRAAAREQQRAARARHRTALRAAGHVPAFDVTLASLEASWGRYATWTNAQHAQHSVLLRAAAGIAEDASPRRRWAS